MSTASVSNVIGTPGTSGEFIPRRNKQQELVGLRMGQGPERSRGRASSSWKSSYAATRWAAFTVSIVAGRPLSPGTPGSERRSPRKDRWSDDRPAMRLPFRHRILGELCSKNWLTSPGNTSVASRSDRRLTRATPVFRLLAGEQPRLPRGDHLPTLLRATTSRFASRRTSRGIGCIAQEFTMYVRSLDSGQLKAPGTH